MSEQSQDAVHGTMTHGKLLPDEVKNRIHDVLTTALEEELRRERQTLGASASPGLARPSHGSVSHGSVTAQ
jgi:hypothetical protein